MAKLTGWTTGLYLTEYDTDLPDGAEVGFDTDFGVVYAYKGKVVTAADLPKDVEIIRNKTELKKEEGSDAFWNQIEQQ